MKKIYTLIVAGIALSIQATAQQLTYSVVTNGLNTVTFDGGGTELEAADIDNDGDLDLISIGTHGAPNVNATEAGIMVWKNNGTGNAWSLVKSGSFGYGGVAVGDVNNDGKMDVGFAQHHNWGTNDFGDQLIEVALGNGTGTGWVPYDDGLGSNGETYGMFGINFADFDGDGLLDLASNSFGCCAGIHAYKNNGNGTWTQTWGATGGNAMNYSEVGDFNRDGKPDWATATEHGNIWRNSGAGTFSSMGAGIPFDWTMKFSVADANNDGADDIAIISTMVAQNPTSVKVYSYDVNTSTWISISNGIPYPATGVKNVKLADMNLDGNCDLLTWSDDSVRIYLGDGSGNWVRNGGFAKPETQLCGWDVADFNHDGFNDVAVIAAGSNVSLKIYMYNNIDPMSLTLLPVQPKGAECFTPGSAHFIKWLAAVPAGGPNATVQIEFSSAGNTGPWNTIVANAPNSGIYQWQIPVVNSNNCFLKFTITSGSSSQTIVTSNAFGVGTCTNPTAVDELTSSNTNFLFPNPAQGSTTINANGFSVESYKVMNQLGATVIRENVKQNSGLIKINLSELAEGLYVVEINNGNAAMNEKLIVTNK